MALQRSIGRFRRGSRDAGPPSAFALLLVAPLAQTPAPAGLDPAVVRADLGDWGFWLILLIAVAFGAAGGVVYELLVLQGNVELPHRAKPGEFEERPAHALPGNLLDLGIWARVIIGGLAALAALLVVSPAGTIRLIATSVVAGSAGSAIFRSLQDRMIAALSQKDAAETRERARRQSTKVAEARRAMAGLRRQIGAGVPGAESFGPSRGGAMGAEEAEEVERLLTEAEGIGETI